jgi:hypothetical protein
MKWLLLCSAAFLPLTSLPAHAQGAGAGGAGDLGIGMPVACTNCTTELTTVLNNIAIAANWVTQLDRMTAQIQQQILIFQQLSGLTNVNANGRRA